MAKDTTILLKDFCRYLICKEGYYGCISSFKNNKCKECPYTKQLDQITSKLKNFVEKYNIKYDYNEIVAIINGLNKKKDDTERTNNN